MAAYAREPRAYELMVILLPELADEELTGAIDRVSRYITDVSGSIKETLTDSPWGRRRLAYTIRFNGQDYRDGIYVLWHFDLEPSRMTEIERELKLDTRVVRYLTVHDDPKWGSPNDGNQPPAGDATTGDSTDSRPTRRRETPATPAVAPETPAAAVEVVPAPAESDTAVASTDDAVATADDTVSTTDEVVGATGEAVESQPEPEAAPGSSAQGGATGEETTAVVEDTTDAAVEAPVDEESVPAAGNETAEPTVADADPDEEK